MVVNDKSDVIDTNDVEMSQIVSSNEDSNESIDVVNVKTNGDSKEAPSLKNDVDSEVKTTTETVVVSSKESVVPVVEQN